MSTGGRRGATTVEYDAPVEVVFDYLADPHNRPEWQSSLRGVEVLDPGAPRVGMRWRDHTAAGIVPEMVITALRPHERWSETGRWRGFEADLDLGFTSRGTGTTVEVEFAVRGRGVLAFVGRAATMAGLFAVRADLRRAARILAGRT